MNHSTEPFKAILALQGGLVQRGYRVAPIVSGGGLCSRPVRAQGLVFLRAAGPIAPVDIRSDQPLTESEAEVLPGLHSLQLTLYMGEANEDQPVIHSINIDHYALSADGILKRDVQRRLGIPLYMVVHFPGSKETMKMPYEVFCPTGAGPLHTELRVLTNELVDFAAWLPEWIDAKEQGQRPSPPPHPLAGDNELQSYGWSRAADAVASTYFGMVRAIKARQRARPLTLN